MASPTSPTSGSLTRKNPDLAVKAERKIGGCRRRCETSGSRPNAEDSVRRPICTIIITRSITWWGVLDACCIGPPHSCNGLLTPRFCSSITRICWKRE